MGVSSPVEAAQNLGKYALIEKLGEGYLGPVYRGFDQALSRPVVVRVLCDGIKWDSRLDEFFDRECRAIAGLQHPNIAAVYEPGREGDTRYIAMESLGSWTLGNLIAQNASVPVETKLSIMTQVADGLSYAHKKGILHRALGPDKIHLAPDGHVKIRDFAIADILKKYLPRPPVRWGTPIYLCPEQIQQKDFDQRSDIFSAGTIFYELVTHFHPFHDRDSNRSLDNILSDAKIPTFEKFPDAPPGIWNILRTCLARIPEERYRSADELASACRDLLKSIAEDIQLMLAELYSSVPSLRKAAAEPGASKNAIKLLQETERLLRGEKQVDYASLDKLMNILLEQYPAIQAAANALPALGSICPQLPPEQPVAPRQPKTETESRLAAKALETVPLPAADSHDVQNSPVAEVQSKITRADAEIPQHQGSGLLFSIPAGSDTVPVAAAKKGGQQAASVYRKFHIPSYRTAAALLSILVLAAAGYILLGNGGAASILNALNARAPHAKATAAPAITNSNAGVHQAARRDGDGAGATATLLNEARALVAEKRVEESKVIIRRILEANPSDQQALAFLNEIEAAPASKIPEGSISRISALIDSGRLQAAKTELDRLQRLHPGAPGIQALRKRWQAANSRQMQSQMKEEDARSRQKEEEWSRQLADLFAHGKYTDAAGSLSLWLSANPASPRAQELNSRLTEIQQHLKAYSAAMAENKYPEALSALAGAEKLNPADPGFAELRRQAETKKSSARAFLTVRRLGSKATLMLDSRQIGKDGEVENESIPIGSHTLAVGNDAGVVALRIQEYGEGQRVALVYDVAKQSLRVMTEADRDLINRRRAMEEAERFSLAHDHGIFRGNCQGVLSIDALDVAYSPSSGSHGFRIPFKLLRLKADGKSVSLYYISDNAHFQTFEFPDSAAAARFKQKWDDLKSLLH